MAAIDQDYTQMKVDVGVLKVLSHTTNGTLR
jgi:hypothetical protein